MITRFIANYHQISSFRVADHPGAISRGGSNCGAKLVTCRKAPLRQVEYKFGERKTLPKTVRERPSIEGYLAQGVLPGGNLWFFARLRSWQ